MPDIDLRKFSSFCSINPPGDYMGPIIETQNEITISHPVHKLIGSTNVINVINPPYVGFVGFVGLITLTTVTFGKLGNVKMSEETMGVNDNALHLMFFDGSDWFILKSFHA